jgi:hypothetical protein
MRFSKKIIIPVLILQAEVTNWIPGKEKAGCEDFVLEQQILESI